MTRRETGEPHRTARAVVPARVVRAAVNPSEERREPAATGPQVEVVREGTVVRVIDVTCACGERIRIVCEYEA
jgi:hypothetical protein